MCLVSLENIEADVDQLFEPEGNPQENWQAIGLRFNQARENIRSAHQNIFEVALVLLSVSTGEVSPDETPDVN